MHFATFTGKVQEVKEFGKAVKLTLVSLPGKDSGYEPEYMEAVFKADSWQGKAILALQKGDDDVTIAGSVKRKKWANGNGYSQEILFGELRIPWSLRKREKAEGAVSTSPPKASEAGGGLDDLPF